MYFKIINFIKQLSLFKRTVLISFIGFFLTKLIFNENILVLMGFAICTCLDDIIQYNYEDRSLLNIAGLLAGIIIKIGSVLIIGYYFQIYVK